MTWAPDYCTTAELAAFIRISDTVDDVVLAQAVTGASRAVDNTCHRQFGLVAAPEARYYTARWDAQTCRYFAVIDDLMTVSGLAVAYDDGEDDTFSSTLTGHTLKPRNSAQKGKPWTEIWFGTDSEPGRYRDGLRITAQWGWSAVPSAIKTATLLQGSRLTSRRDSPYGVAGSLSQGSELRLLSKVDPDVEVILQRYIRRWAAV